MGNRTKLFEAMAQFTKGRTDRRAAYDAKLMRLEAHRGSQYFAQQKAEADRTFAEAEERAKDAIVAAINPVLAAMQAEAAEKFVAEAPTDAMLNMLTALKMRTGDVSNDELDSIARAMNGNNLALLALNDLADEIVRKRAITSTRTHADYARLCAQKMTATEARRLIDNVAGFCADVIGSKGQTIVDKKLYNFSSEAEFYDSALPLSGYAAFKDAVD